MTTHFFRISGLCVCVCAIHAAQSRAPSSWPIIIFRKQRIQSSAAVRTHRAVLERQNEWRFIYARDDSDSNDNQQTNEWTTVCPCAMCTDRRDFYCFSALIWIRILSRFSGYSDTILTLKRIYKSVFLIRCWNRSHTIQSSTRTVCEDSSQ